MNKYLKNADETIAALTLENTALTMDKKELIMELAKKSFFSRLCYGLFGMLDSWECK